MVVVRPDYGGQTQGGHRFDHLEQLYTALSLGRKVAMAGTCFIFIGIQIKIAKNIEKHKVEFSEAASVFLDNNAIIYLDSKHSNDEVRQIVICSHN